MLDERLKQIHMSADIGLSVKFRRIQSIYSLRSLDLDSGFCKLQLKNVTSCLESFCNVTT